MEMDFASFLNFLTNLSFLFLLGSMIFYWVGLSIGTKNNDPTLPSTEVTQGQPAPLAAGALAQPPGGLAAVGATLPPFYKEKGGRGYAPYKRAGRPSHLRNVLQQMGNLGMISSNLILFFLLGSRWMESGHFPSSNLYESLMFLSWCFTTLHLFLSLRYANFSLGPLFKPSEANDTLFLGAITTPSALFTNAFATITLPKEMQEAAPLVPALQSNWLMMHVTVMILSYAALILGSLLSIAFLIVTSLPLKKTDRPLDRPRGTGLSLQDSLTTPQHPELPLGVPFIKGRQGEAPLPETSDYSSLSVSNGGFIGGGTSFSSVYSLAFYLDNLSYRILGIGFPFLTIGILSGAVWANEAWGSYWSWDPKETWALLTWLIFAIYLHTRLNIKDEEEKGGPVGGATPGGPAPFRGRQGSAGGREGAIEKLNKKPAIVASFGFIVVWICYLGVNLIGEGLHSYGWIDVS